MLKRLMISFRLLMGVLLAVTAVGCRTAPVTTVYLVRHAEKELTPGLTDPPLTAAGEARAEALRDTLHAEKLAACFTTDTRRTRATLARVAIERQLPPLLYDAQKPADLVARLRRDYAGQTVVVVGHSNTLLPLLAAMGVTGAPAEIGDDEYSYLFEVQLPASGAGTLRVRHYGAQ